MEHITLDFTGIATREALHARLREVFALPRWYGDNLDALWDCLYASFSSPVTIRLQNIAALPPEMGALSAGLLRLLRELAEQDDSVTVVVADGKGEPSPHTAQ